MAHGQPSLRTDLGRTRGLGSARHGVHHWWMQRVSSIALAPLSLFWLFSLHNITDADHAHFVQWIGHPGIAIAGILFVITSFYHAALGLQVVVEDYVHHEGWKLGILLLNQIGFIFMGVACTAAIVWLSLAAHVISG